MNFISILEKEFSKRAQLNSSYSIRAFARDLGIDQSSLSRILAGKRSVTKKFVETVAPKLNLNTRLLAELFSNQNQDRFEDLSIDKFLVITEWYHDAILECIKLNNFEPNPAWVATKLRLKKQIVKAAIDRLVKLDLLEITSFGNWIDKSPNNAIHPTGNTNKALLTYQKQILKKSEEALIREPISRRSHTSITFPCGSENLNEAKLVIDNFRKKISNLMKKECLKSEVYQLQIGLYPITVKEKKHEKQS